MSRLCKIGLACGGGGAKGLAHLGVLCAMERGGLSVDILAGTSMGALVAATYALTPRCDLVIERFRRYLAGDEFKKTNPEFLHAHEFEDAPLLEGIFQRFTR